MKTTLTLNAVNGGPFDCFPGREVELANDRILCNNVMLPHDRCNPRGVCLLVIGNEFGPLCAVWADCEQDALDTACDAGLLAGLACDEPTNPDSDEGVDFVRLGNAGGPHDLAYAWIQTVRLDGAKDWELIARFAEARGACADTLDR